MGFAEKSRLAQALSASAKAPAVQGRGVIVPQRARQAAQAAQPPLTPTLVAPAPSANGVRAQLVQRLASGGISHPAVLQAFAQVPRHQFVDAGLASQAYEDTSLPIGLGQTISKPSVVGRMLSLLLEAPGLAQLAQAQRSNLPIAGRVLEIGTGCGYQAALLAHLALRVTSVERLSGLHDKATANLAPLHLANLQLVLGDGMLGHSPTAPFFGIIAAAGGHAVPQAWIDQLAIGGRIVAPVATASGEQWLTVIDKTAQGLREHRLAVVRFVPLKSGIR